MRNSAHIQSAPSQSAPAGNDSGANASRLSSPAANWIRRAALSVIVAAIVVASAVLSQEWFANAALAKLQQSSSFAISGNASALQTKLQKFRLVPVALSADPELREALEAPTEALRLSLNQRFEKIALASNAAAIYLIDRRGEAFAASNYQSERSFVGQNYSFREYFQEALKNRDAEEFAIGTVSGEPGLYLSRAIVSDAGANLGVIVTKLQFDDIEAYWRDQNRLVLATDSDGRIMVTSLEPLRFQNLGVFASGVIASPPPAMSEYLGSGPVLATSHPVADGGWIVSSFEPLKPALATARIAGLITGASLSALILAALAMLLYRIARNARQLQEVAANRTRLEAEVKDRTRQLQESYAQLTQETKRRESVQAELSVLQDEITQLNRLAILGQLSAKFAHEINQPLTAMRNYVENSVKLLALGDKELVASNLDTMSGLMKRAARITDELRAFSRKKPSRAADTPIGAAIDGALLIASHALQASGVIVERAKAADQELVRVDKVRIEQVVLNVVQNAIEALTHTPQPKVMIASGREGEFVSITIADNGPGVENVEDLFIPFRTGKNNGLGLGLSISTEILSEYGGSLDYHPVEDGGAAFIIRVPRVPT